MQFYFFAWEFNGFVRTNHSLANHPREPFYIWSLQILFSRGGKKMTDQETNSFLDTEVTPKLMGTYLNKSDFAGDTVSAEVVNVGQSEYPNKLVIQLDFGNDESSLLTIGPKNQNELIRATGSGYPKNWIGKKIKLAFSEVKEFDTKDGKQKGCSIQILKP